MPPILDFSPVVVCVAPFSEQREPHSYNVHVMNWHTYSPGRQPVTYVVLFAANLAAVTISTLGERLGFTRPVRERLDVA
jgi:hypothetical protein